MLISVFVVVYIVASYIISGGNPFKAFLNVPNFYPDFLTKKKVNWFFHNSKRYSKIFFYQPQFFALYHSKTHKYVFLNSFSWLYLPKLIEHLFRCLRKDENKANWHIYYDVLKNNWLEFKNSPYLYVFWWS